MFRERFHGGEIMEWQWQIFVNWLGDVDEVGGCAIVRVANAGVACQLGLVEHIRHEEVSEIYILDASLEWAQPVDADPREGLHREDLRVVVLHMKPRARLWYELLWLGHYTNKLSIIKYYSHHYRIFMPTTYYLINISIYSTILTITKSPPSPPLATLSICTSYSPLNNGTIEYQAGSYIFILLSSTLMPACYLFLSTFLRGLFLSIFLLSFEPCLPTTTPTSSSFIIK